MKYLSVIILSFVVMRSAFAFEPFTAKDIRLEGLQRIKIGTVFNYLPIKPGDKIEKQDVKNAIHALYKTGFFKDIQFEREGDILVIFVAERPAINNIEIEGNDAIPKDQLNSALKQIGLVKGRVFNRSVFEGLKLELQRQYYSMGKYNMKIDVQQTQLERNRVDMKIKIAEGESAEIYAVNIIGNKAFSDKQLLDLISLAEPSFFSLRNSYKKQQLAADLEKLKTHYLDNGYLNFEIESTQVSLGPERESVYVTINIKEGKRFTVRDVKLAGNMLNYADKIKSLVKVKQGDIFSQRKVVDTTKAIRDLFAENGYAESNVNMVPDIDQDSKTVALTFFTDPGRRIYVRKVNITGNLKTQDKVIRRELRQLEADWLSTKHVARSRTRLERLGFFSDVSVETRNVPGTDDQMDLNYHVTEKPTGSLQAGIGYSDTQGALVNLSVTQDNFLGTGERVGINFDNSSVTKQYSFNYTNPYYTPEGISRTMSISYRNVDASQALITNYSTDSYGASLTYGVPLSEYTNYQWGIKYDSTKITTGSSTSQNILDFINLTGDTNRTFQLFTSWSYDSRNRRIFATRGSLTYAAAEIAVPGGDLEYYKLDLRQVNYFPFGNDITLAVNMTLGYGVAKGGVAYFPPYKNYFVGGSTSLRGYDANSVGPKDSVTGDPTGGTIKLLANMDLIFPNILAEKSDSTRISLFVDGGTVYRDASAVDFKDIRFTAGLSFIWITPVGALRFNFATPLNEQPGDSTSAFQFSLGSPF